MANTPWQFLLVSSSLGNTILSFPISSRETHDFWKRVVLLFSSWLWRVCKELFCFILKHSGEFWQGTFSEIYFKPYIIHGSICLWKIDFLIFTGIYFSIFWRENKRGKVKCNSSTPKCSINIRQVTFTGFALLSFLEQNAQCYKEYLNSPVFKLHACWELQTGRQLPLTSLLSRDYTFRDYLQHRKSLCVIASLG